MVELGSLFFTNGQAEERGVRGGWRWYTPARVAGFVIVDNEVLIFLKKYGTIKIQK